MSGQKNCIRSPGSPLAGGWCAHPWGSITDRNSIDEVSPMVWGNTDKDDKVIIDNLKKNF